MKKGTNTRPEVFIALAEAYESGNTIITERIESILTPSAMVLPEALQTALDKMGDTPISEPEAFGILQKDGMDGFGDYCSKMVNLDGYDAVTAGTFIGLARARILTDVDKDGVFKTTPTLDKMRLPSLSEVRRYSEMAKNGVTENELVIAVLSILGLTDVELTDWEQELVKSIISSYTQVTSDAFLGKVTDRTPFARYLKNT